MNNGLTDKDIKKVYELMIKANAEQCVALGNRFNVQAQWLVNKSEEHIVNTWNEKYKKSESEDEKNV